jgi:pantoate--beta-alanine ligase
MKIIKNIAEIKKLRSTLSGTIGFIPTMGFLHEGHLSLVQRSQEENSLTIVSIFVNPKQFGPNDDFQKYPRDTQRDLALLEKTSVDIVFLPILEEFYPKDYETSVSLEKIPQKLEGAVRPGHFTGVATVLTKFFNLIQPTHAYFGQKDAQQVVVVKKMVKDLNFSSKIIVGETLREKDGLAMSSRNVFLNPSERKEATVLYNSLCLAKVMFEKKETNSTKIKHSMEQLIQKTSGKIDYISIADPESLEELATIKAGTLISLAVRFGTTRLIDNVIIE